MKKGVVLIIVFAVLIVISLLAITAINLMRQQSKITEHKISRRRKLLAAQAGMVHAYEGLRRGVAAPYNNPLSPTNTRITDEISDFGETDITIDIEVLHSSHADCDSPSGELCIKVNPNYD
ncbi:MAG: hypothetical protein R6U54_01910 [Candidatus Omnitrophota bacterium]